MPIRRTGGPGGLAPFSGQRAADPTPGRDGVAQQASRSAEGAFEQTPADRGPLAKPLPEPHAERHAVLSSRGLGFAVEEQGPAVLALLRHVDLENASAREKGTQSTFEVEAVDPQGRSINFRIHRLNAGEIAALLRIGPLPSEVAKPYEPLMRRLFEQIAGPVGEKYRSGRVPSPPEGKPFHVMIPMVVSTDAGYRDIAPPGAVALLAHFEEALQALPPDRVELEEWKELSPKKWWDERTLGKGEPT
jgi:hypothetical protein